MRDVVADPLSDRARWIVALAALAVGYAALAWLGLALALADSNVSPFWPAAGLAVGALWRWGLRLWPGVLVGSAAANILVSGADLPLALAIAMGSTLGLGGAAWLLRHLRVDPRLERPSDPWHLLAVAVGGTGLASAIGAAAVTTAGGAGNASFAEVARTWWTGDLAGVMAVTALVSTWTWRPAALAARWRKVAVLTLVLTGSVAAAVALGPDGHNGLSPWAFVLFPPLLLAGVLFGPLGAATVIALVIVAVAMLTQSGIGPFVGFSAGNRIHLPFQLFTIAAATTALVLAAYARNQALASQALRDSEERYRLIADHARDLICLHELDGRYRWVSPSAPHVVGWPARELLGRDPCDFIHPDDRGEVCDSTMSAIRAGRRPGVLQFRFRHPAGGWTWLETACQPVLDERGVAIAFQSTARDISQRKADEQRLAEAQRSAALSERMASIGTLAGGVAHEFNNLNAVVMGNVELALHRPDLPPDARRRLEQIREAVDREKGIVDALLAFSRQDRGPRETVDVCQVVTTTLALARRTLRQRRVALHADVPDQPVYASIPTGSLGQVLLNLLLNACDAVDRRHDPQVWVALVRDGARARLTVRDNGVGIDPQILPRIFEPFYSTKGEHALGDAGQPWLRGTGLGLAVCQTLVGQMGGVIEVASRLDEGATFAVAFPLTDAPPPPLPARQGPLSCARVLVVDDEAEIRRLLCEHLTAAGHVAVEAKDGQQALDHLGQEEIDVVLLNWCMPGLDGQGVLEHMELHPERRWPPVIVVSGWAGGGSGIDRWRREIAGELRKPFSLDQVRASVERALCG